MDIAVNFDNTLLAAGSLDRILRVWCFQTMSPVSGTESLILGDRHASLTLSAILSGRRSLRTLGHDNVGELLSDIVQRR